MIFESCHVRSSPGHVSRGVTLLFLCSRASLMRSGGHVLRIISCMFRIANAQWGPRPAHYQNCLTFDHQASCELVPAVSSPPPVASLPGQQAPLASSAFCLDGLPPNPLTTSVDQNAEGCSRCCAFLHLCLILVRHYAVNIPVSSRRSSRLHVLAQWSIALVSCVE